MGEFVEANTDIVASEEGLHQEIVGGAPKTCVCDTKTLLAHIAEDGKTFQHVIDEMKASIEDDKQLKAQLLANEVI
jgi:hypothetical protein